MAAFEVASSASASGQVDISTGITCTGTDRFMLAIGHVGDNTPGTGTSTITSTVDTLTAAYAIQTFNAYAGHIGWQVINPSTTTQTLTLNRDAQYNIAIAAYAFSAVDQTTPTDTWLFDTGANLAQGAVASATNDLVFATAHADDNAFEPTNDLTERVAEENFGSDGFSMVGATAAGAATVNASFNNAAGSYGAGGAFVNINNAGAAPSGPSPVFDIYYKTLLQG